MIIFESKKYQNSVETYIESMKDILRFCQPINEQSDCCYLTLIQSTKSESVENKVSDGYLQIKWKLVTDETERKTEVNQQQITPNDRMSILMSNVGSYSIQTMDLLVFVERDQSLTTSVSNRQ